MNPQRVFILDEQLPDQRYVIFQKQVFKWSEKEPYVKSGFSILGGLEYNMKLEMIKCHECGGWCKRVSAHLVVHNLSALDYKLRHGIMRGTALMIPALTQHLAKIAINHFGDYAGRVPAEKPSKQVRAEQDNLFGVCRAQVLASLKSMSINGVGPSINTLSRRLQHGIKKHFGSYENALKEVNLKSVKESHEDRKVRLIEILRDFYVLNKRLPVVRDFGKGRLPARHSYERTFGHFLIALDEAGLGLVARAYSQSKAARAAREWNETPLPPDYIPFDIITHTHI